MLQSGFPLSMPLVDHCCGVCTLTKAVGESVWCVTSTTCVGGCECANYTADCELPEEMTGINEGPEPQVLTLLCTPCAEHFGEFDACGALCEGECLVKVLEISPGNCTFCVLERTCEWGGTADPEPGQICDCVLCGSFNCDYEGVIFLTPCQQWFPPTTACPNCTDLED